MSDKEEMKRNSGVERRKKCAFDKSIECPSLIDCCANGCTEHPEMLDPEEEMEEP